jgi:hypothetical protein
MSEETRNRPAQGHVAFDDVDDLIHTATRLMQKDTAPETLTTDDLKRIGQELDIPARYIDQAMEVLEQRRREQERARLEAERARQARRALVRKVALVSTGVTVALAGVLGLWGVSARNGLNTSLQEVTRQRVQVHTALERRQQTQERYATSTPGPERDAQLSGADNRVGVEQRRYNEAATAYNASASAFPRSLVVRLSGMPASVPLSSEMQSW